MNQPDTPSRIQKIIAVDVLGEVDRLFLVVTGVQHVKRVMTSTDVFFGFLKVLLPAVTIPQLDDIDGDLSVRIPGLP